MTQRQTHPSRQTKIFYALRKLGMDYSRCRQCNSSADTPMEQHTATQIPARISIINDRETREENQKTGTTVMGSYQRAAQIVAITCINCGSTNLYDLDILNDHI